MEQQTEGGGGRRQAPPTSLNQLVKTEFLPFIPVLTMVGVEKGGAPRAAEPGEVRPYHEIRADLSRNVWPKLLTAKKGRGNTWQPYATWETYDRIMNIYAYGYQHDIVTQTDVFNSTSGKTSLTLGVRVSIPTADLGLVPRTMTGRDDEGDTQEINPDTGELLAVGYRWDWRQKKAVKRGEGFAPDDVAWSKAFRRACNAHGLMMYLRRNPKGVIALLDSLGLLPQSGGSY